MSSSSAASLNLTETTFSKTATGLQEIQTRAMGLPALIRRVLVLVDGKRSVKELAAFVGDNDITEVLDQLVAKGCIDAQVKAVVNSAPEQLTAASLLTRLPDAATRSPKEIEMARNFMSNTTNNIFGQNMRLSLIKTIDSCESAEELRQVYPAWADNMASISAGAKRMKELNDKLFVVL